MTAPQTKGRPTTKHYYMRHLRIDLHERARFVAALEETSVEGVINAALALGLAQIERAALRRREREEGR